MKLRISKPAPASRMSDTATSEITSRLRKRWRTMLNPPEPCDARPPDLSDELRSSRAARSAGARPNRRPVSSDTAKVKARTPPSMAISFEPRNVAGIDGTHRLQGGHRDGSATRTAGWSEDHRFGQQLAHDLPATRAERRADRHFLLAAGGA